jgi:hypothetical protein
MINLPTNALRRCRRTGRSQHQALDEVKREICTRRRINDQGQHARIENNEEDPRETKEREGFGSLPLLLRVPRCIAPEFNQPRFLRVQILRFASPAGCPALAP